MSKRVLDVGNCDPDHSSIKRLIEQNFAAEVVRTHNLAGALEELDRDRFDLVLVNRLMDEDGSPGIDIIKSIKGNIGFGDTPVLMITNFEDYQELALAAASAGIR